VIQQYQLKVEVLMQTQRNDDPGEEHFSIGTVVEELQANYPEVSHSSLRFLEREGLVSSTRTAGGHRLYSRGDIERIGRIKSWQRHGMSLDAIRLRLEEYDSLPQPPRISELFLQQALDRDIDAATQTVLAADEAGLPLEVTFNEVLRPALVEVGNLWESGAVLVSQEKEISEVSRDLVSELTLRHQQRTVRGPLILAGCVEGERHEIGLRMICGLLREEGFRVRYLGADIAPRFLLDAVRMRKPDVVLLSVTLASNLHSVRDAIETLRSGLQRDSIPPVVCGGHIASEDHETLRGWGVVPVTNGDALEVIRNVTGSRPGAGASEFGKH
jgi:methanogenic corrinoid protein MtbC1